jgi:hypothetical protein
MKYINKLAVCSTVMLALAVLPPAQAEPCSDCEGGQVYDPSGWGEWVACSHCGGDGEIEPAEPEEARDYLEEAQEQENPAREEDQDPVIVITPVPEYREE